MDHILSFLNCVTRSGRKDQIEGSIDPYLEKGSGSFLEDLDIYILRSKDIDPFSRSGSFQNGSG